MARKLPNPAERSEKEPAVLCSSERVLALYNGQSGKTAQRVSAAVRTWFGNTALEEGWDEAIFIKDVETRHSAGCVLFKRPANVQLNIFIGSDDEA